MGSYQLRLAALALVALAPASARATENFPGTISAALGTDVDPPCTLCHATALGQKGNVVRPFGTRVLAYGLTPNDADSLKVILGKMREAHDDSDRDGVSDIDELTQGTDPNINDVTGLPPEDSAPPEFGCQASRAASRAASPWRAFPFAGAALLAVMWLRARKRSLRPLRAAKTGTRGP
jgi:hypothetical protein